jgi:hypothetical protein
MEMTMPFFVVLLIAAGLFIFVMAVKILFGILRLTARAMGISPSTDPRSRVLPPVARTATVRACTTPRCLTNNPPHARFCRHCGRALTSDTRRKAA